jgi:hypothetical protein
MPRKGRPVKSLRIKKVEPPSVEDLFGSSDIPEDFWSSVVRRPERLKDCFWESDKRLDPDVIDSLPLDKKLKKIIEGACHIRTKGDGLCGVYAIVALLMQYYEQSIISGDMEYKEFIDLLSPFSRKAGIEISVDTRPQDIDEDTLCSMMNKFIEKCTGSRQHVSFAIFDLSSGTVVFKQSESSRCLMKNLFTIVYKDRHFEALLLNEKDRQDMYVGLQKFMRT